MTLGYLDHAATTSVRPEARDAMAPWHDGLVGNPSGAHRLARDARRVIDDARDVFAAATGFESGDIVFTSGGTEADNLAIAGTLGAEPGVAVTLATEHHAVLHPVEAAGGRLVGVAANGQVRPDDLVAALDESVRIVSVMAVNNETGVIADLASIVALVREHAPRALIHTDAVQALMWLDLSAATAGVDLLSLSAHKFGGPQGVGVLAVGPHVRLQPMLLGGSQERDRRAGTQNVAGIVGAGAAAAAAMASRRDSNVRIGALRDRLVNGLLDAVPEAVETGVVNRDRSHKIAGNAHLCFSGAEAEALLVLLENAGVYASAGSSCASGAAEPSHVLTAMGIDPTAANGSLRLSLGWSSTAEDIDLALQAVPAAVARLRSFV